MIFGFLWRLDDQGIQGPQPNLTNFNTAMSRNRWRSCHRTWQLWIVTLFFDEFPSKTAIYRHFGLEILSMILRITWCWWLRFPMNWFYPSSGLPMYKSLWCWYDSWPVASPWKIQWWGSEGAIGAVYGYPYSLLNGRQGTKSFPTTR
jgi:hypothetical protein